MENNKKKSISDPKQRLMKITLFLNFVAVAMSAAFSWVVAVRLSDRTLFAIMITYSAAMAGQVPYMVKNLRRKS